MALAETIPREPGKMGKSLASEENWRQIHQAMAPVTSRLAWLLWLIGALTMVLTHLTPVIPAAAFLALIASAVIMQRNVTKIDAGLPPR